MEMIVYMGLAVLLLALMTAFFRISRRQYEAASSSSLIGQEASLALQWLKRDLQETALSTIRITLEGSKNPGMPSMSFIASGKDDEHRSFSVSRFGTPEWNRHVFYNLSRDGEISTWTRPLVSLTDPTRFLPRPSSADPSDQDGADNGKILLREIMQPNQQITIDAKDANFPKMTQWGGFKPGFVVYDTEGEEHLVAQNPAQISETFSSDPGASVLTLDGVSIPIADLTTTRLVEVQLALKLKGFRDNSPSAIVVPLRVCPGH